MPGKLRLIMLMILTSVIFFAAASPAEKAEAGNRIADGVFLGNQNIGGMALNEAVSVMEKHYRSIAASNLKINVRDIPYEVLAKIENGEAVDVEEYDVLYTVEAPVSAFGFDYSVEDSLRAAATIGRTGKLVERYKLLMDMKHSSAQLPLSYSIDGEKVKNYVEQVFVPENTKEPKDASFGLSGGTVVATSASQDGISVNASLTANAIMHAFEAGISDNMSCSAIVGTTSPKITSDAVASITGTVASYTTNFWTYDSEANESRSENIRLAAQIINGTLLMPGETLSLNKAIGKRTEERGFKVAHAYLDGKVIDSVGGGICQFATTMYQCVLQTELPVIVRKNHSMMVDYVDYSQDATLDWQSVDFAFTNNWEYPIYIACSTTFGYPSSVTVTFYSTDVRPKNRTVEYKTIIDSKKSYNPQVVFDWDAAPGKPVIEGVALDEVSSHLEKIVRVNGIVESTTRMNDDYYRYLRQTITVGAKGTNLTSKWENDIQKMYDGGNQLLMNSQGMPYYNGNGGYLLVKDYQHDGNGYSTSASPVPLMPLPKEPEPTPPPEETTTEEPPAEPAETEPAETEPAETEPAETEPEAAPDGSGGEDAPAP